MASRMRLPLLHVFVGLSTLISVQANYTASKTECDGFGSVKDISFVAGGPPQPDFHSKKDRSRAIQFKEGPGKDVRYPSLSLTMLQYAIVGLACCEVEEP